MKKKKYTEEEVREYESINKLIDMFIINQEENYNEFLHISQNKNSYRYKNYHKHNVLGFMSIFEKYYDKDINNNLIEIMNVIDMFQEGDYKMKEKRDYLIRQFDIINKLIKKI